MCVCVCKGVCVCALYLCAFLYLGFIPFCTTLCVCVSCLPACLCVSAHASYLKWRLADRDGAAEQNEQIYKHWEK